MRIVALDTETDLIVPGRSAPRLTCVSLAEFAPDHDEELYLYHVADPSIAATVTKLLQDPDVAIVGQNIAYDAAVLCAEFPQLLRLWFKAYLANRVCDTGLREQLIDVASLGRLRGGKGAYSLAAIAERRLGITLDKDTHRLGYGPLRYVPLQDWPPGADTYALDDAKTTLRVYEHQQAQADDYQDGYGLVNEFAQTRAAFALRLMSCRGVRTDRQRIDAFEAKLLPEFAELQQQLIADGVLQPRHATKKQLAAGVDVGYKRTKAVVQQRVANAYAEVGQDAPLTDTMQISTNRKTLQAAGDAVLARVARFGELEKLLSTYVPLLRRAQDVPLNAYYGFVNSGRTSASPNLQNQPREGETRACFVPRPRHVFCSVDYDTAELRALAAYCEETFGYSRMAEALRAGDDIHLLLAATILGISAADAKTRLQAGDPEVVHARQLAKNCNFSLGGGAGAQRFAEMCQSMGQDVSVERAQELKDAWFQQWPEMVEFMQLASVATTQGGMAAVTTPWSGRVRANCYYSEWLNAHFQGPVADAAKAALFAVAYECYTGDRYPGVDGPSVSPLLGARPVLFLHDEIICEIPYDPAPGAIHDAFTHAAARRQAYLMRKVAEQTIKTIPMTCAPALMVKCWIKGAKTVYNADGVLVPCDA